MQIDSSRHQCSKFHINLFSCSVPQKVHYHKMGSSGKCIAGEMSDVFDFHGRVGNRTVDLQKKRKFPAVIEKKYFRSR